MPKGIYLHKSHFVNEETKHKISKSLFGRKRPGIGGVKKGNIPWNKGLKGLKSSKRLNQDEIIKMQEGRKKKGTFGKGIKRKKSTIDKIRIARMKQKLPYKDTSIEKKIFAELELRNILFVKHKPILGITQPDVFISPNICIYCDGDYWHSLPKAKERDKKINKMLQQNGFLVLRYWEHEINVNTEGCVDEIMETANIG